MRDENRVALYLRLSREDLDKLSVEERSESIKNQERMLRDKAIRENWEIVDIYIDEDYSGADSNRPEFRRMIQDCEDAKIDIVLCKSQSRFSRDMEIVEEYIHNKFILWGVRFVSLVDNADTNIKGNKKSRQINALMNEWYLEDTSNNIRDTLRNKKEAGLYTGAFAPYGYIKDSEDKNHLIIDPVAAEVVKKIFNLYKGGWGYYKIREYLEKEKVLCPYEYKRMKGYRLGSPSIRRRANIDKISKIGSYIIYNSINNVEDEKITDVISIGRIEFFGGINTSEVKFHLSVHRVDRGIRIFYTTKLKDDIQVIDFLDRNIWTEVKVGEMVADDFSYIGVMVDEIRRRCKVFYELELAILDNRKDMECRYLTKALSLGKRKVSCYLRYEKKPSWSERTIAEILRNETYIGNLVQGKFENISYKNHKAKHLSRDKWIVVKNTHDAIIDDETWRIVQERLGKKLVCEKLIGVVNPLSGKVYCDVCGKSFEKNVGSNHKYFYLVCRDKRCKWRNCDNRNSIRLDLLEKVILKELNKFILEFVDLKLLNNLNSQLNADESVKDAIIVLRDEIDELEKEKTLKKVFLQQVYEDRINGAINEELFDTLSKKYEEDMVMLEERTFVLKEKIELIYHQRKKFNDIDELVKKYLNMEKLTTEVVNCWIDKIIIGKIDEINRVRKIKIIWKF